MQIERYVGGILDTNAYLLSEGSNHILIDAPQGANDWLQERAITLSALWLTHTHFDHVLDVAAIQRQHQCPVLCHALGEAMLADPSILRQFGFDLDFDAARADRLIDEGETLDFAGRNFELLFVPGHSPDSLCFYQREEAQLFGGDVLFAGGVGRADLPGGDWDQLVTGIRQKIFSLPDEVRVWPGHGPATTVGAEKASNPYVRP